MYMLKIATVNNDKDLSFRVKGQKTESNAFFSITNIETTSVHHFPALWYTLTLASMEKNLRTEQSVPIDTMPKIN